MANRPNNVQTRGASSSRTFSYSHLHARAKRQEPDFMKEWQSGMLERCGMFGVGRSTLYWIGACPIGPPSPPGPPCLSPGWPTGPSCLPPGDPLEPGGPIMPRGMFRGGGAPIIPGPPIMTGAAIIPGSMFCGEGPPCESGPVRLFG